MSAFFCIKDRLNKINSVEKFINWIQTIRSVPFYWLIIGLIVLHLIPIWAFKYFPSQDGPSHIENAYTLLHYFDEGRIYSRYYDINFSPVPNWFSHLAMAFFMIFLPPIIAEKMLLTIYIVFFVMSIIYLLNSVDKEKKFLSLLAFPFIYNYLFHMGFYNFVFSLPLMFIIIGYWWRNRDNCLYWKCIVTLNLLLILLYFCHLVSQLLAISSILILAAFYHRLKIHKTILFAISLIPSYLLPIYYVHTRGAEGSGKWQLNALWDYFAKIGSLASYDLREYQLGRTIAILFALLVIYTIIWEKIGLRHGKLKPKIALNDTFFLLSIIFFFLYLYMPDGMSKGGFITTRLCLYPFLIILPWLSSHFWKPIKYIIGVISIVFILIHLGFTTYYIKIQNQSLKEYTSGVKYIEENKTILPISFNHNGPNSARIGIFLHAKGYYCAGTGAIALGNYEANTDYFPLKYKTSMDPRVTIGDMWNATGDLHPEAYPEIIDYILLWSPPEQFTALSYIQKNYRLIHSQGRLRLYKFK